MFYVSYILDKDPTEYNGIESFIREEITSQAHNWFPIGKAYELSDIDDESEKEAKNL